MELLSYVLTAAAVTATEQADTNASKLPTFKPRFWYNPERLDARPVAWSLINRPDEWEWVPNRRGFAIEHKPSGHVFWVGGGRWFYCLDSETPCGCSTDTNCRFQRFQQGVFHKAFRQWRRIQAGPVHENFASHFIH